MSDLLRQAVFRARRAILLCFMLLDLFAPQAARADTTFSATVVGAGNPIEGSTVTVYAAGPSAAAAIGSGQTDSSGVVTITISNPGDDAVLYAIATGGDAGHWSKLCHRTNERVRYSVELYVAHRHRRTHDHRLCMVDEEFHFFHRNHFRTVAGTPECRTYRDQPGEPGKRPILLDAIGDKLSG